ncbi:PQQ-dependent sugar dehydrogenase [Candidatus Microgenomates bacterium]|nr:PQQ-dependent sugar dehydrogenase [Candidatus Microgenomates bacterium]
MHKLTVLVSLILLGIAGFVIFNRVPQVIPPQTEDKKEVPRFEVIARNLEVPWALAFLPDGKILVTERKGIVKLVDKNGAVTEVGKINVTQVSESGLHGIAIDPKFSENHYIYLYYTYSTNGDNTFNRVSRFNFDSSLKSEKIIIDQIPGAPNHDGGRIKFGLGNMLYITTGDAQNPSLAQDKESFAGKILRVTQEDKIEIFSYGHRNPQGITWDDMGNLWETEHGQTATDEINLIQPVRNYGWPIIRGDQSQKDMASPYIHSGSNTWAPAGVAFFNGSLYFGGLRGQALFEYNIERKQLKEHFKGQFGRLREVVLGPDNMLYITTSNRDGRGNPQPEDDKIIRMNPEKL